VPIFHHHFEISCRRSDQCRKRQCRYLTEFISTPTLQYLHSRQGEKSLKKILSCTVATYPPFWYFIKCGIIFDMLVSKILWAWDSDYWFTHACNTQHNTHRFFTLVHSCIVRAEELKKKSRKNGREFYATTYVVVLPSTVPQFTPCRIKYICTSTTRTLVLL